jgi:hypothetical protein
MTELHGTARSAALSAACSTIRRPRSASLRGRANALLIANQVRMNRRSL